MNNKMHPKHYPRITSSRPPVDLFIPGRSENDEDFPIFNTGLSKPIYDLNGNISRQLPLDEWPLEGDFHPEVYLMQRRRNQVVCSTCRQGNLGTLNLWSSY
jgi:hypothetical protein